MVARMFTTAPLLASAMAAKSGSDCTGAPAACAPFGLFADAVVAPCAAWGFAGCSVAGEQAAPRQAVIKEKARIAGFMGQPRYRGLTLRWGARRDVQSFNACRCRNGRRRAKASRRRPSPRH